MLGGGKPDGFVGAGIKQSNGAPSAEEFNAASYCFFGDLPEDDGVLGGSLEEGLDAPPDEEEMALEAVEPDEDLSLISMFKNQTQLVAGKDDAAEEGREGAAGVDGTADAKHEEGLDDMALIEDYLKEVSALHTTQKQHQEPPEHQTSTPAMSPTAAAALYGVHLPSSLSPPPFLRQTNMFPADPMPSHPLSLLRSQASISAHQQPPPPPPPLQQQQQQPQPLKVSRGPMTAEQLEAQMLGKVQPPPPPPQPPSSMQLPQLQPLPPLQRPQRSLEQVFVAEAQQQQQQQQHHYHHHQQHAQQSAAYPPVLPYQQQQQQQQQAALLGRVLQQQQQQQPQQQLGGGGGGGIPPLPHLGMQPHILSPHLTSSPAPTTPLGATALPGAGTALPGAGINVPPFLAGGPHGPAAAGAASLVPPLVAPPPPFGPPLPVQQQQQMLMMMQAMSQGGPRPLTPPLMPPPGLGGLSPHLQAAAMEQHHMHAMMLARSGLAMPRPPVPPPHMQQQQQQQSFRTPPMPFFQQQHQQQQHPMQPHQRSLQPFRPQSGPRTPPAGWGGISNSRISRGRPVLGGELMSPQELGHIMQIMYAAVHSGIPYVEDYYYQAFVNKHANGANAPAFEPQALQDLSASVVRLDPSAGARFAALDGLGKFVLSNIRTPKVLMDLSPQAGGQDAIGAGLPAKPLEQEPLLAARIMIEDCLHLMLDVDDIDRLFTAAAARAAARREGTSAAGAWGDGGVAAAAASLPSDAASLRQRRALLAAGLTSSLRLPASPDGSSQAAGPAAQGASSALQSSANGGGTGDGVLLRIMSLAKGRALVARALRTLLVPPVQYLAESGMRSSGQAGRQLPPTAAVGRFENGGFKLESAEGADGLGAEANGVSAGAGIEEDMGMMEIEDEEQPQQGRPEPTHLLWGVLRTAPKLFILPGGLSMGGAGSGGGPSMAEERAMLQATHRLAASLCHVLSQMTKPRQLADALTALSVGLPGSGETPFPLVHAAPEAEGPTTSKADLEDQQHQHQHQQQPWLGEVVHTLLARGCELHVDSHPTAGPTWRAGLQGLQAAMMAHIQACLRRAEGGSGDPHTLHAVAALCCPSLMDTLAHQLPSSHAEQLRSALKPLLLQAVQ